MRYFSEAIVLEKGYDEGSSNYYRQKSDVEQPTYECEQTRGCIEDQH